MNVFSCAYGEHIPGKKKLIEINTIIGNECTCVHADIIYRVGTQVNSYHSFHCKMQIFCFSAEVCVRVCESAIDLECFHIIHSTDIAGNAEWTRMRFVFCSW